MSKRKAVTDFIVKAIDDIIPGYKKNGEMLREMLESLSDSEFDDYIKGFKRDPGIDHTKPRSIIPYYLPNLSNKRLSISRLFDLHGKINRSASQRLIMHDQLTGKEYVTPHEYPIVVLPVRRQSQTVSSKSSIPTGRQPIDELTHQPIQQSKGASLTQPEIGSLAARGLDSVLYEILNVRGGNETARREFRKQLLETGSGNLDSLSGVGTIKSIDTMAIFLNGMHLGNNSNPDTKIPEEEIKNIRRSRR